jgi:prevent-host-death family protein
MPDPRASVRDLRNHGGDVLDRVEAGERIVVTRDGRPVAELVAVHRGRLGRDALLARWRHVPRVDGASLRHDLDAVLDPDA